MELDNKIMLNMAINNVEHKIKDKEVKVGDFKNMVLTRYRIYKDIHKEVGK